MAIGAVLHWSPERFAQPATFWELILNYDHLLFQSVVTTVEGDKYPKMHDGLYNNDAVQ